MKKHIIDSDGAVAHALAMKQLRDKYNIFIEISVTLEHPSYYCGLYKFENKRWIPIVHSSTYNCEDVQTKSFQTYEEVCDAAIKYCLENLI